MRARRALFREQMVQTYIDYFKTNYAGNRAPLHIGHHFSDYQHGAYREALQIFARTVCGLPEVRCTTYAQLADFMDCAASRTRLRPIARAISRAPHSRPSGSPRLAR